MSKILFIEAIKVPNTAYMSYGVDKEGNLAFVYGHETMRGAKMKTSRIINNTDKNWKFSDLAVVAWQEVTNKDFTQGVQVWV